MIEKVKKTSSERNAKQRSKSRKLKLHSEKQSASRSEFTNRLMAGFSPFPIGLTVVNTVVPHLLAHARCAIERLACERSNVLGIPMPDVDSLLCLYSGNPRRVEQAKALAAASPRLETDLNHDFKVIVSRDDIDWCSDAGLRIVGPIIRKFPGWLTLELQLPVPVSGNVVDAFSRIRRVAKDAQSRAMLFTLCPEGHEKTGLERFCDEYIEIAECEPDPDTFPAFSIDCIGLDNLNGLGIGKTMCTVRFEHGKVYRRYAAFISASLETRIVWILRGEGKTLTQIAEILTVTKSTVLRRLQRLPTPVPVDMPRNWLNGYLQLLNLIPPEERPVFENDDEEEGEQEKKEKK